MASTQNLSKGSNPDLKKAANSNLNKADALLEKRRVTLDARHKYLIEKAAEVLGEKALAIENSLLVGSKLELVNEFFQENGSKKVVFFWQTGKVSRSTHR